MKTTVEGFVAHTLAELCVRINDFATTLRWNIKSTTLERVQSDWYALVVFEYIGV